jgi:prophage antirepressor-like protein
MNELQLFSRPEFGSVRTYIEPDGTVLFCASDIAKALGYSNVWDAVSRHCKGVVKREGVSETKNQYGITTKQTVTMSFIPEGDIYRLTARSQLPSAEKFESWIFDEVLPSIRSTGGYTAFKIPQTYSEALEAHLNEVKKNERLAQQIVADKPYTTFAKAIETTRDTMYITDYAKLVQNTYKGLGRNILFRLLRDKHVFYYSNGSNLPMQEYISRGYFVVKESTYTQNGITATRVTTMITGKGQIWLSNKLEEWLQEDD